MIVFVMRISVLELKPLLILRIILIESLDSNPKYTSLFGVKLY